jgi:predicted RNase H-like HicB family nuclease
MRRYVILVEGEDGGKGYSAYSPDVPGCGATGKTEQEAVDNAAEAIRFHLENMLADGEEIPAPSHIAAAVAYIELPSRAAIA